MSADDVRSTGCDPPARGECLQDRLVLGGVVRFDVSDGFAGESYFDGTCELALVHEPELGHDEVGVRPRVGLAVRGFCDGGLVVRGAGDRSKCVAFGECRPREPRRAGYGWRLLARWYDRGV